MKKRTFFIIAGVILMVVAYALIFAKRERASILLINGKVHTGIGSAPHAEAVAIRADRIVGVGSTWDIQQRFEGDTVVDLEGGAVYPGFIESHAHVEGYGASLMTLNLTGTRSVGEIQELVRADAATGGEDHWVRGRGWDQNDWPVKRFPTHEDLDSASVDVPVYLVRVDGHAVWVNKKVLDLAGISSETPDPPGGKILRDAKGMPTGVFVDNAIELLASVLPSPSRADRLEAVRRSLNAYAALGVTEIHDMGVDLDGIALYKELAGAGMLPVRIYAVLEGTSRAAVEHYLKSGPEKDLYEGRLTVRAIKLYADGALGSRGAALVEPYADDPGNRGLTVTREPELIDAAGRAIDAGFQLCVHAIGDRGCNLVLSTFEKAFKARSMKGLSVRFRVEHAQILQRSDIPRFAELGVIPSMQPTHCTSDMPWAESRLGRSRVRHAYPWASLIEAGSIIPAGSDAPVEDPSPLKGYYAAITRQREDGTPPGGWFPEERMSRTDALNAYTIWGAYASFHEELKGTIETGKWADLVVLSDDLLLAAEQKIPSITVELTMVGGKVTHSRPGLLAGR